MQSFKLCPALKMQQKIIIYFLIMNIKFTKIFKIGKIVYKNITDNVKRSHYPS